jgi:hypothetical protein
MKKVCDVDVGKKSIASFVLILVIYDVTMIFTSGIKIDHLIKRVSTRFLLGQIIFLFFLSSIIFRKKPLSYTHRMRQELSFISYTQD